MNDLQTPGGIEIVSNFLRVNSSEPSSFHLIKNSPSKTVKVSYVARWLCKPGPWPIGHLAKVIVIPPAPIIGAPELIGVFPSEGSKPITESNFLAYTISLPAWGIVLSIWIGKGSKSRNLELKLYQLI